MPVFFFFFKTIHGLVSGEPSFIPKARITRPTTSSSNGVGALVKLRIRNHKLMIEIGRYNQTTKNNRHCLLGDAMYRRRSSLSFSMSYILYD